MRGGGADPGARRSQRALARKVEPSMSGAKRVQGPEYISQSDRAYPDHLIRRLGADAPEFIAVVGSLRLVSSPMTAFLCSKETPGATILKAFDQATAWRDAGRCVISGFHSPLEKECLDILLRGKQPVVMAIARRLSTLGSTGSQKGV